MKGVSQKNRFVDKFGGDQMHFRGWMETIPEHVGVRVRCDDASIQLLAGGCRRSQLAAQAVAGADGLCFLPYLSPAAERVPFLNTGARGSLFGLSFEHGREHLARAVLEGLSLVIRDCLQASQEPSSTLDVCGLCGKGQQRRLVSTDLRQSPRWTPARTRP